MGLSRRITVYELAELQEIWPGVTDAYEHHWLVVPEATIDEVRDRLPDFQAQLEGVKERAAVVQAAAEALAAGEQDELKHRLNAMSEINRSLAPYRRPPTK